MFVSRPLRIERAGGWYHVTARGNERRPIYRDARDRRHFCELLAELVPRFHLRLHCLVLNPDHHPRRVRQSPWGAEAVAEAVTQPVRLA